MYSVLIFIVCSIQRANQGLCNIDPQNVQYIGSSASEWKAQIKSPLYSYTMECVDQYLTLQRRKGAIFKYLQRSQWHSKMNGEKLKGALYYHKQLQHFHLT